jgi:hypothetical protein
MIWPDPILTFYIFGEKLSDCRIELRARYYSDAANLLNRFTVKACFKFFRCEDC